MPYLTYEEYQNFGFTEIDEPKFNELIQKAGDVIDGITRHFYGFNDIEKDVPFRRKQFKKAVGAQLEYFSVVGSTNYEEINSAPQTFQAGRTAVSNTSRFNASGRNEKKSIVSEDALLYLRDTGLLHRGMATW